MSYLKKSKTGVGAVEAERPHENFYALPEGKAVFEKPLGGYAMGSFQNSYFPMESSNFRWISARCKLKTKADSSTNVYYVVTGLYGVRPDGKEELIGEYISNSISTTENVEEISFDLASSSSYPDLTYLDSNGATSGKLYLKLPSRWKNFNDIKLKTPKREGWQYCWVAWVKGSNVAPKTATWPLVQITVHYLTGMKSDFSDVRFIHPDGKTFLCYDRVRYVANSWATFNVLIDVVAGGSTNYTPILVYYGNPNATDKSAPKTVYGAYHGGYWDFEDGNTSDFTTVVGTKAINTSAPISGSKSIQHTGNGSDNKNNGVKIPHLRSDPNEGIEWDFDFKAISYGSSNSPYYFLLQPEIFDTSNNLWVDFLYDPGTNQTNIRLCYTGNGTSGETGSKAKFCTGKLPLNTKYHINIRFQYSGGNNRIFVSVDNKNYITYVGGHHAGKSHVCWGFGSNTTCVGLWDNIKVRQIYPHQPTTHVYGTFMTDNFDDNSIDSTKWVIVRSGTNATVVETNKEIQVTNSATGHRATLRTAKKLKPPYMVRIYAKKGENVEFFTHWDGTWNGLLNNDNGVRWLYASWNATPQLVVERMLQGSSIQSQAINLTLDSAYHKFEFYVYEDYTQLLIDGVSKMTFITPNAEGYFAVGGRETPTGVVACYNDFMVFDGCAINISSAPDLSPNTPLDDELMELIFNRDTGTAPPVPFYIYVDEKGVDGANTNIVRGVNQGRYALGYDSIDKYIGLKFKATVQADNNCNIEYSDFTYEYEVLR